MYLKKIFSLVLLAVLITACNKSSDDEGDDPSGDFGSLTFYHNDVFPCNTISISITKPGGGVLTGTLGGDNVVNGIPNCDVPNTFTFLNLAYGTYQYQYTCGDLTLNGQISLNEDCFQLRMSN